MQPAAQIEKSPTLAINERVNQLRSEGKTIYSFGLGQSPFPVPDCVISELIKNAHQKDYLQVQGLKPLREAVSDYHDRENGIRVNPDRVLIGPGSKELIFQLMLCFEGEIILVSPCWVTYYPQAQVLKKRVHFIHTTSEDEWKINPATLEEKCRLNPEARKLLILNYPSNPCGNSYSLDELRAIAAMARTNNCVVLSDEIYGALTYDNGHVSMATVYPEGTIVSSGLSKWCGAGGWRLGTFAFPVEEKTVLDKMVSIASETFTAVSAPIQFAAIRAFSGGTEIDDYLDKSRKILFLISTWIVARLTAENIILNPTKGGFYVFPDFRYYKEQLIAKGIRTSSQLCEILLNEIGIASLPGTVFSRPEDELTLRLSFVSFDGKKTLEEFSLTTLSDADMFMHQYCPEIEIGINRIIEWLRRLKNNQ